MKVMSVVGARPNFMKLAPVDRAMRRLGRFDHTVVHTGQHYDPGMSDTFFEDLGIPEPSSNLGVGSASHARQTADVMRSLEPLLTAAPSDLVLVYGDVNSTLAAALVASKLQVPVGHVEAGLRSRDRSMPEEINRLITDRLSDLLFTPSRDADANLAAEGIPPERLHFVGNVMIDSLTYALPAARDLDIPARLGLAPQSYAVVTLHRPSNVDSPATLRELIAGLSDIADSRPVLFPLHPRTERRLAEFGISVRDGDRLRMVPPLGYLEMLGAIHEAAVVITDSGGLQEETAFLGVPCVTLRSNTERPVTIAYGTNRLAPSTREGMRNAVAEALRADRAQGDGLELWDGHAADRIVEVICDFLGSAHVPR